MEKHKIYCFINSGKGTDWNVVVALADDGRCLAQHVSSNEGWAMHDIGLTSTLKHDYYREAFPDGYELEWVDSPNSHQGLARAYELNQKLATEAAS